MVNSMKWLSGFLIVGTILFSACKSSDTPPGDQVSLGVNQSARIGSDITVRADSIRDGRCPTGVVCIWAGQAKVKLLLSSVSDSSVVRLSLGANPGPTPPKRPDSTNVTLNTVVYKVILRDVTPYPEAGSLNQPQTAVVQVTKI